MKSKIKQPNQGFSLIELLVVIAIISIVGFVAVTGIGMIGSWKMKDCAVKLDTAIGETQMLAMSKGGGALEITRDAKGSYYMQMLAGQKKSEKQKIADGRVDIYYVSDEMDEMDDEQPIPENHPLTISFDAGSGAYLPLQKSSTENPEDSAVYCKKLVLRMGKKRVTTIKLIKDTGRHYIE